MHRNVRWRVNAPRVTSQIIDGEAIMINLESGNYYNLNSTGTDIWDGIEKGISVRQIADAVAHRYDGSPAEIEKCVSQLIADLEKEELIVVDGGQNHGGKVDGNGQAASSAYIATPFLELLNQSRQKFEAPVLQKYTDMQDLLLLDPIHEVDELGWPRAKGDSVV